MLAAFYSMIQFSFAQTAQQQKIDSVCELVKQFFNEKKSEALYELAGEDFRKQLSAEVFQKICSFSLFPLGEIKKSVFESHSNGLSKYKLDFGAREMALYLSLDKLDKIETLLFKPYLNENAKKKSRVPSSNALSSDLDLAVDSAVQPYISLEATVGLSIGILKDGKSFFYGYGETGRGNKQIPNEHTIFEMGSLSKTFTSILLASAVQSGKMSLADPINKYLPDSIPALQFEGKAITLQTLANHSSGIPRMPSNFYSSNSLNPYKDYAQKDLFEFYKNFKPYRRPGEKYEYSNLAVGTLGVILENVYHATYESLVLNLICLPLHMSETREFLQAEDSARFAKGYNEDGGFSPPWDFKALQAAGSLRSTSSDLIKYARANLGEAPGKLNKAIQLTHSIGFTDGENKLGLAWHYIKPGKEEVLFHNGQTGAYHSYFAVNLDKKFAVVILSNSARGTEELGNQLIRWLESH